MRTVLEAIKDYKHICWYPSAGNDFRALLFLSDWYYEKYNVPRDDGQVLPDLFVMTDYTGLHEWRANGDERKEYALLEQDICPPGTRLVEAYYHSTHTFVTVKRFEKLEDLTLSFDPERTNFDPSPAYNTACLLEVEVESRKFGITNTFDATVLYVTCQNEAFANEFLIPNAIKAEYQLIIRYGEAMGGALLGPAWIIRSCKELGIKYLIANSRYVNGNDENGDSICTTQYEELYSISGGQWSDYGKVGWYKLY